MNFLVHLVTRIPITALHDDLILHMPFHSCS